ncbi:MAG: O-antigen ligase family protein [Thermostichales cyanobacterium BF3_bins_165]
MTTQLKRLSWDWFWQEGWLLLGSGSLVLNLLPSALCLLAGVVYHWGAWRGWLRDPLALWIGGLLGGMGVVTSLGVFPWASWAGSFNYWPFWLVFGGVSWGLRAQGRRRWLLLCLTVGGGVLAILGILDGIRLWLILGLGREYRPLAVFTSHNILGVWLVLLLLVSYGWRRDPRVWIFWILAGLMVLLTGSRNSWGILMVGLLVLWLVQRYWLGLAGLGLAVGAAVGAALDWPGFRWLVPPLVWQRLREVWDPTGLFFSSTQNRWDAWRFAWGLIQERPWTGWGWQSFAQLHNQQLPPPAELLGHAHNLYLHIAAEGGIPLLLGMVILWGWIWGRSWQAWYQAPAGSDRDLLLGVNIALGCFFLSGMLDAVYLDGRMHLLVWLLMATGHGAWLEQRQSL